MDGWLVGVCTLIYNGFSLITIYNQHKSLYGEKSLSILPPISNLDI